MYADICTATDPVTHRYTTEHWPVCMACTTHTVSMAEKNVPITAEIQNKSTGLDHLVVNCAKLRDWVRLRELSIRPGGFGEDRACVW